MLGPHGWSSVVPRNLCSVNQPLDWLLSFRWENPRLVLLRLDEDHDEVVAVNGLYTVHSGQHQLQQRKHVFEMKWRD